MDWYHSAWSWLATWLQLQWAKNLSIWENLRVIFLGLIIWSGKPILNQIIWDQKIYPKSKSQLLVIAHRKRKKKDFTFLRACSLSRACSLIPNHSFVGVRTYFLGIPKHMENCGSLGPPWDSSTGLVLWTQQLLNPWLFYQEMVTVELCRAWSVGHSNKLYINTVHSTHLREPWLTYLVKV